MSKKKTTILVVDHDPQTYKILDLILDKDGFAVVPCLSGRQAIQLCVSIKPEMILLDLSMPDMDSREIIKAIREWSQVPVIIVSSHSTNEDVVNGLNNGADDYPTCRNRKAPYRN